MKTKSGIGIYVFLSVTLVACITGTVILGLNIFTEKPVKMQNLESYSKEEVFEWASKNKVSDLITYTYEYSSDVEEGMVISQSIEPDGEVNDNFTVCISKGSIIKLNINDFKTKKEFEDFISKYPNVIVAYEEDEVTNDISELTKFSKDSVDIKADSLTVFVSKNAEDTNGDEKENEDNKEDDKNSNKVLIPADLLGMEEDKFIKKLNDLGFKNLKKDTQKYYSFKSKKDTIFSYDDGKFDTKREIKYAISLGDYVSAFNATEYNTKALADAKKTVEKYNDLNAHITLKTNDKEVSDDKLIGKLSNCNCVKNGTNSIITCDLGNKAGASKNVVSYAGKTENEMLTALKELGFTKFNKNGSKYSQQPVNCIAFNDTGNKKITDTINYTMSLGTYIPNLSEYEGKSLAGAKTLADSYNSKGANVEIANPQEKEYENLPNGTLTNCKSSDVSGKKRITCDLVVNIPKYEFPSKQMLKSYCSFSETYNGTVDILNGLFNGKFTNWRIEPVSDAIGVGQILDVKVAGQNNYSAGLYKANTEIVIYVVQTQE